KNIRGRQAETGGSRGRRLEDGLHPSAEPARHVPGGGRGVHKDARSRHHRFPGAGRVGGFGRVEPAVARLPAHSYRGVPGEGLGGRLMVFLVCFTHTNHGKDNFQTPGLIATSLFVRGEAYALAQAFPSSKLGIIVVIRASACESYFHLQYADKILFSSLSYWVPTVYRRLPGFHP
ncbi:hypothetical protein CTA1_12213, partial [Colletotrichum tanaceti]